jgi:hypothetical protein
MKLIIDCKEYELNINRAEELGVLTKVKASLTMADLKVGDVFKFKLLTTGKFANAIYLMASKNNYVMLYGSVSNDAEANFDRAMTKCWFGDINSVVAILNVDSGIYDESC